MYGFKTGSSESVSSYIVPVNDHRGRWLTNCSFIVDFIKKVREEDRDNAVLKLSHLGTEIPGVIVPGDWNAEFTQRTYNIATTLDVGTDYQISMTGVIRDAVNNVLIANFDEYTFNTLQNMLASVETPGNNAQNVATGTPIVIQISDDITWEPETVANYIKLMEENTTPVPLKDFEWFPDTKRIQCRPENPLNYYKGYTINISEGLKNVERSQAVEPASSFFRTIDGVHARASLNIDTGVVFDGLFIIKPRFTVDFGKKVRDIDVAAAGVRILNSSGVAQSVKKTWQGDDQHLMLEVETSLANDTNYKVSMLSNIMDNENLSITPFAEYSFKTLPKLTASMIQPLPGELRAFVDTKIVIKFSDSITWNPVSDPAKIEVKQGGLTVGISTYEYNDASFTLTITPEVELGFDNSVQVAVKDGLVSGRTGMNVAANNFSFRTEYDLSGDHWVGSGTVECPYTLEDSVASIAEDLRLIGSLSLDVSDIVAQYGGVNWNDTCDINVYEASDTTVLKSWTDCYFVLLNNTSVEIGIPQDDMWPNSKDIDVEITFSCYNSKTIKYFTSARQTFHTETGRTIGPVLNGKTLVYTVAQLNLIRPDSITQDEPLKKDYLQVRDINMDPTDTTFGSYETNSRTSGWTPIGNAANSAYPFTGHYDGNNRKITGLYIRKPGEDQVGLFGRVSNAGWVKNLTIEGSSITGNNYVGSVIGYYERVINNDTAGYSDQRFAIENIINKVSVSGRGNCIGGIIGCVYTNPSDNKSWTVASKTSTIDNCENYGYVSGGASSLYIGGIIGRGNNNYAFRITNCTNHGIITAGANSDYVGGIVGELTTYRNTESGHIVNIAACYNESPISGRDRIGGYVGSCDNLTATGFINN